MTTLQESWKQYRNACYPPDMPADQNRECHQAFMAGAFTALTEWIVISRQIEDEDLAAKELGKLLAEAEQWCRLRAHALNEPRN